MTRIFWLILLSFLWPLAHTLIFILRFDSMAPLSESVVFLPMGFLSAGVLHWLWQRARLRRQRIGLVVGYLVGAPVAFIASLLAGLINTIWGPSLYGAVPLLLGMLVGYGVTSFGQQKGHVTLETPPDR